MRVVFGIIATIALAIWSYCTLDANLKPELQGMVIAFCIAITIDVMMWFIKEARLLRLYLSCINPFARKEIRLTIAYLFKIEVNGRYLLVKSNRLNNTYQPVGGVYKYFHPEATLELNKLCIVTDNNIPNDEDSEFDLRLKQNNKLKLPLFIKWFLKGIQRETDPWREFYEELIVPGILPANYFPYLHYELVGQHYDPIHYDTRFRTDTFKYADIYIPKYVNHHQETLVRNLVNVPSTDYIWATEEEIKNNKSNNGHAIATHSYKIFHTKKLNK